MSRDILSDIQMSMGRFSKGQKRIAGVILSSYDKAAFMTANRLGEAASVSESTVVRFAAALGFDGYPAMQRALQEMIRNKLTSVQRIEVSDNRIGAQDVFRSVLQSDMDKIRLTLEGADNAAFCAAVDTIVEARRIYILGVRSASAIAVFLHFYLHLIFEDVIFVETSSASEMIEQMIRIDERDVFIGISFPRYSRRTVNAMKFARSHGADTVAITDSVESPMSEHATRLLIAKSDMASFVDSLVAPLSMVNALIVAVGRKKKEELNQTFQALERIWEEYNVYEKVEM